ncbi:MAG: zinc-ribbon domain-containing protein [Proteobacteria bacterium]|nr:zinc-ribbon domain-containing protein [Pseudomonadota bacterium]
MDITCPKCQFSRQVPDDKIPGRSVNATCPQCGEKFRFRSPGELVEPAPVAEAPPLKPVADPVQEAPRQAPEATGTEEVQAPPAPELPFPSEDSDFRMLSGPGSPEPSDAGTPAQPQPDAAPQDNQAGHDAAPEDAPQQATPPSNGSTRAPGGSSDIWQRLDDLGKAHPGRKTENGSYSFQGKPSETDTEADTVAVPFEDLERYGFFGGLWETIRRTLFNPGLFFEAMPLNTGLGRPLIFYILLGELAYMFMAVWEAAGLDPFAFFSGRGQEAASDLGFFAALSGHFVLMFIMPLLLCAAIYVNAGIVHLLLKIFRAGDSGFKATFRVCCYANATGLLYALPFVGIPLSFLWQIVVIVAGLKAVHRTSYLSVLLAYSPIILLGLMAFAAPFITPADIPPSM